MAAQFKEGRKIEITRNITKEESFAKSTLSEQETVTLTVEKVTACYVTFSAEGKEDFRRKIWRDDGNEYANYLKAPGCSDDCVSSADQVGVTEATEETTEEKSSKFEKGQKYNVENLNVNRDTAIIEILDRTENYLEYQVAYSFCQEKRGRAKIKIDQGAEFIMLPVGQAKGGRRLDAFKEVGKAVETGKATEEFCYGYKRNKKKNAGKATPPAMVARPDVLNLINRDLSTESANEVLAAVIDKIAVEVINLQGNGIRAIPGEIFNFPNLVGISIDGNPIENIFPLKNHSHLRWICGADHAPQSDKWDLRNIHKIEVR